MDMSDQILLVDDDLALLDSFEESLEIRGYHTLTATNGLGAIDAYKKVCPCIVFMDIKMPEMDGYEAFLEIKKHDDKAKVVFVTGYNDQEKSKEALKNGLIDVLNKPVSSQQILDLIKENGC